MVRDDIQIRAERDYAVEEALKKGLAQGREEGREEGREQGREELLNKLLNDGAITLEYAITNGYKQEQ